MKTLVLLALASPAVAQVAVTIQAADQATIPGSTRSLYATVQGTKDLTVKWSATGGCTLASATTNAAPEIVTAPAVGGQCRFQTAAPTNAAPSFLSPVSCTVTATSVADPGKSGSIVIPVCAPAVMLTTFPSSTVLYKNQYAMIQSDLRGAVNTAVTWVITTNPGQAGTLTGGASNRHAVFSAKAPGTYVLTATSAADGKKRASTTLYVTPHELPPPNADHTEAVDCTAVGNGRTLDVGPARAFRDLNAVPWNALKPGDTVRIHNDDLTGTSPTTYHQHISISSSGSPAQPLRVCGVPDAKGIKPIVDGENATSRPDADWASGHIEPYAVISLFDAAHKFDPVPDGNENVVIEGLHIRNANASFKFVRVSDSVATPYGQGAACVRVQTGRAVLVRGNDLERCTQAVFSNATTPEGGIVYDLTVEGNYIHQWGVPGHDLEHGMYLQGIGLTVQFNYFAAALPQVRGSIIKSRSTLNFLRWNFLSQAASTARAFDMVEPQAYACTVIPYVFAVHYHGQEGARTDCYTPHGGTKNDPLTADQVAANFEAYHSDYIYGNIMDDDGTGSAFVHYGYDQETEEGPAYNRRGGTLFYWNNTHLTRLSGGPKVIFDMIHPDQGTSYEYATVESINNVFAASAAGKFLWTRGLSTGIVVDSNWVTPGYELPNRRPQDAFQGAILAAQAATCDRYGLCKAANGRMQWSRNGKFGSAAASLYMGAAPFSPGAFLPAAGLHGLAARLPQAIENQPSNMQYFPATNTIAPRLDGTYLGALD